MARKIISIEEVAIKIRDVHGDNVTIDKATYTCLSAKATFFHKKYGRWETTPFRVVRGASHKKAAYEEKSYSLDEIVGRLKEVHGDAVTMDVTTYINVNTKAIFIHKTHGKWLALPSSVLRGCSHKDAGNIKNTASIKNVIKKLEEIHGDTITIYETTYTKTRNKAKFNHKIYGDFESEVKYILSGGGPKAGQEDSRKKTCMEKYGSISPMRNRDIAIKQGKSNRKNTIRIHWKTGEELICQASWEPKVVDYLNANEIDFLWQPKVFDTPLLTLKGNASTYRPDLFLVNENKWIEIKGWFRGNSKAKWDWFQSEYVNSELWDEKKLKCLGIL
jgi:hypothetical protein